MAKQKSKKHHSKPHGGGVSYGKAVFLRQLSIAEMREHDLMPDPRNHLHAVRKG